jgi:hypothetical protein
VVNNSAQRFAGCVRDAHALGLAGPPFLLGFQRLRFPNPIGTGKSSKIVPPMATTWSSSLRPANNVHAARSGQESLAEVIYAPKGCYGPQSVARSAHSFPIFRISLGSVRASYLTCTPTNVQTPEIPGDPLKRWVPVPTHGDGRRFRAAKSAEGVVIPVKCPGTGRHLKKIDEFPIAGGDVVEA